MCVFRRMDDCGWNLVCFMLLSKCAGPGVPSTRDHSSSQTVLAGHETLPTADVADYQHQRRCKFHWVCSIWLIFHLGIFADTNSSWSDSWLVVCMDTDWQVSVTAISWQYYMTMVSQLSGFRLSIFECLDVTTRRHVFCGSGKRCLVTGVLLQEKAKLLYEWLSLMLQCLFQPVRDLDHDLQRPSLLSEATNTVVHCITVLQIKRCGK